MRTTTPALIRFLSLGLPLVLALSAGTCAMAANGPGLSAAATIDNASCLMCHERRLKASAQPDEGPGRREKFAGSVHAKLRCVDCHTSVTGIEVPHQTEPMPDCARCHQALWEDAKKSGRNAPRLALVARTIEAYERSFHARKNADDPSRPNASCDQCHDTHAFAVPVDKASKAYAEWRLGVPALCAEQCHEEQLESFQGSVHGSEISEKGNAKAAVCSDCHTAHEVTSTSLASFKLLNPEECGNCHKANLTTYRDTYHGQIAKLGYPQTAKCYECHGSHEIRRVADKKSKVHPDNRLKTCRQCHDGTKATAASAGFVSFGPHAHAGDFQRYPQMWIAGRFMIALLAGVFAFFWLHSGLWYLREWKDRKLGKPRPHVLTGGLHLEETKHVRRFGLGWRIAHLAFALATMTLVLTGTAALYADSAWAPVVARALGGAESLALIHRIAAATFIAIFFAHFIYVMFRLLLIKRDFKWLGPDSLVPRLQDLTDCVAMFKWFLGRGPRPALDRWAYYEKFDYWAVFWGVFVIGGSGLLLAFPHLTASVLPGWVFNVATLVHGEEAFLASVFLFTVHFFNNHFRPDKLPPPDVVMFTGVQSLEEFRRDHRAHYERLVGNGELGKYLVDAPSAPITWASKLLGLALIACGLILLVLVFDGFLGAS